MSIHGKKRVVTSKAEEVLTRSNALFRALIDKSSDIIVLANAEGMLTYVSSSITHIMGYSPEELVGSPALALVHPDDLAVMHQVSGAMRQAPGTSVRAEYRLRCKGGSWRWFEGVGTNLLDDVEVGAIVGNFRDITERKRVEEALQTEEQRFRMVWESASDAMALSDKEGRVLAANPSYYQLYGFTPEEVIGQPFSIIFPKEQQAWAQTLYHTTFESEKRDGSVESTVVRADGTIRIVETSYDFLVQHGRRFAMISIIRDITEAYEAEQRKDEFIGMASHELKTPITTAKGLTQLVKRKLEKQGATELIAIMATIETQLNRLTKLVNELLDVSKIQAGRLDYAEEPIDIDELIQGIVNTAQLTSPTHTIIVEGASRKQVLGDPDRLEQVFLNLISNAVKYSPQADTIVLRMSTSQEKVIVRVQDFGVGIPQEHQGKVFERFYRVTDETTKGLPGLGMGLYISSEIVKRHGGEITVESEEGKGSLFTVALPIIS